MTPQLTVVDYDTIQEGQEVLVQTTTGYLVGEVFQIEADGTVGLILSGSPESNMFSLSWSQGLDKPQYYGGIAPIQEESELEAPTRQVLWTPCAVYVFDPSAVLSDLER